MSSDLPTTIRQALHADDITVHDLRHPVLRDPRPGATPRTLAAVSGILAVLLVVVVAATVAAHRTGSQGSAAAGSLTSAIGYRWRVTHLVDANGSVSVASSRRAEIGFTRDGYLLGDDTLNAIQARYRLTRTGYTVSDPGETFVGAVGSAGGDPVRERMTSAVDAMFLTISAAVGETPAPVAVLADVDRGVLTLHRGAVILTLERAGSEPDFLSHPPSSTAPATR